MEVIIENKDAKLYTSFTPNEGKETVILLHGGPGVPEFLEPIAAFLSQQYQVLYFHQRGTLKSPCLSGNFSMQRYISDIDRIAEHFGLQQFHLFGHSWGGLYAQLYAEANPQKLQSMFCCSPASGTGWQWAKMSWEISRFMRNKTTLSGWLAVLKNTSSGLLGSSSAYRKFYTQFSICSNKGYGVSNLIQLMTEHLEARTINRTNKEILLHPVLKPQLNPGFKITITYGDDDIYYGNSPNYVIKRYPTASSFIIPGSSHFSWLHNKEEFFRIMAEHYGISYSNA